MKKSVKKVILFIVLISTSIGLLACDNSPKPPDSPQYQIFLLASKSGFNGTYGEWLASIKGSDGSDGKNVELQVVDNKISWRYVGGTWTVLISLSDLAGANGITPNIGANGNWFIGATDTGIKASGSNGTNGTNGTNGLTPHIGENGNWFIGTTDTGIKASGSNGTNGTNGTNGLTPHIGENGNWFIGATDTGIQAGTSETELKKFTITFDVNSGVMPENTSAVITDILQGSVVSLPIPTMKDHIFKGWFTGTTANDGQFYNFTPVFTNLTLQARWERIIHNVTIEFQGTKETIQMPRGSKVIDLEKTYTPLKNDYIITALDSNYKEIDLNTALIEADTTIIITNFQPRHEYLMNNMNGLDSDFDQIRKLYQDLNHNFNQQFELFDTLNNLQELNHLEVNAIIEELRPFVTTNLAIEEIRANFSSFALSDLNYYQNLISEAAITMLQASYDSFVNSLSNATITDIRDTYDQFILGIGFFEPNNAAIKIERYRLFFENYATLFYESYNQKDIEELLTQVREQLALPTITVEDCILIFNEFALNIKDLEPLDSGMTIEQFKEMVLGMAAQIESSFTGEITNATTFKELAYLFIKLYGEVLNDRWQKGFSYFIDYTYEQYYSLATEESKLLLQEVKTTYLAKLEALEFLNLFEGGDIFSQAFLNNFQAALEKEFILDTAALNAKKTEVSDYLTNVYNGYINMDNANTEKYAILKTEIEQEIANATSITDLDNIHDTMDQRFRDIYNSNPKK